MMTRTTRTRVTFRRSFRLAGVEGVQPAGTYGLVTEEKQIPGLSYAAFRRTATMLHLPANPVSCTARQVVLVNPVELAEVLAADAAAIA
jgi:hypothetical protein